MPNDMIPILCSNDISFCYFLALGVVRGPHFCELLSLSAVLGEFSCGHCIVTCSIGKRNVF